MSSATAEQVIKKIIVATNKMVLFELFIAFPPIAIVNNRFITFLHNIRYYLMYFISFGITKRAIPAEHPCWEYNQTCLRIISLVFLSVENEKITTDSKEI